MGTMKSSGTGRTRRKGSLASRMRLGHCPRMQPVDIQVVGQELAVKWTDGGEDFVPLETLRRFCPCAGCLGEKDIFGKTYRAPERPYGAGAFELSRMLPVGGYAVQLVWRDGHNTGLYTWEWIKRVAAASRNDVKE